MALDLGTLQAALKIDTSGFTKGISDAVKGVGNLGVAVKNLAKSMLALLLNPIGMIAAAIAGFVALGKAAWDASEEIADAYDYIRIGTGATGESLRELEDIQDKLFRNFAISATTAGTVVADLNTRLGLTGDELYDLSEEIVKLSIITKTDVATNVKNITRLFGDWSIKTEDCSEVLNKLFIISQSTGITLDALTTKVVQYGTSLRGMGFTFEESTAMLGKFEKEGVNTETVLASLKIGLANLASQGVTDAGKAFKILVDDIKKAPTDIDALNKSIGVFGARAGSDMAKAIQEGRFEIDKLIKSVNDSTETIDDAYSSTIGFSEAFQIMGNKATLALQPLGELIEKNLNEAFKGNNPFLDEFLPSFIQGLTDLVVFLMPLIEKIKAPFIKLFGKIGETFSKFWNEGKDTSGDAVTNIIDFVVQLTDKIAEGIDWFLEFVYPAIEGVIEHIVNVIKLFSAIFAEDWDEAFKIVGKIATAGMTAIYKIAELGWNALMDGIQGALQWIVNGVFDTLNAVVDGVENSVNGVIDSINMLITAFNSLPLPDIDTIGNVVWDIETPQVPQITRFDDSFFGQKAQESISAMELVANGTITLSDLKNSGSPTEQTPQVIVNQNIYSPVYDTNAADAAARRAQEVAFKRPGY